MRKFLLLAIMACFHFALQAQVKKMYGYVQEINGGARLVDDNSPDNRSNAINETNRRFFLFAEVEKAKRIVFEEIWINGHAYNFKTDTVKHLPHVLRTSNGGELVFTDTLVRSATGKVIQFTDLVRTDGVITKNARRFVTPANAVIFYRYKGKLQYIILKKLKQLRPLFTQ